MNPGETGRLTMDMAKVGYESYCEHTGWKSAVTGCDLPKWSHELPPGVINAWYAAAEGMIKFLASHKNLEVID